MSTTDKPDPARAALFLAKLVAEGEAKRIEGLSDEEFQAEQKKKGHDALRTPSTQELLERVKVLAARQEPAARDGGGKGVAPASAPKPPAPVVSIRRSRIAWLLVAALAIAAAFALTRPAIVARFHPNHGNSNPDDDQSPRPTRHEAADLLRDEALDLCGKAAWVACKDKLDEAARLDPAGESEPRVQKARADIQSAERPGPNAPKTPGP